MDNQLLFAVNQAAKGEYRQRNGRMYLVAPMVSLREGVLNNELVLADEFGKHILAWNGRPFVIGHPKDAEGKHISANSPDILDNAIGQVFGTAFDGKLSHQVWIDISKASATAEGREIIRRVEKGEPLDVSSAYWRDLEQSPGERDGKEYTGIARNLRPDHVAALLYENGACSWQDGCGVPRVNSQEEIMNNDLIVNPFPNEHAARIARPGEFKEFRRRNNELGQGIHVIFGIKVEDGERTSEIQAIRFDKDRFTPAEAREWLKDHDFSAIEFEKASGPTTNQWLKSAFTKVADALGVNLQSNSNGGEEPMSDTIARIVEAVGLDDGSQFTELSEETLTALADALENRKEQEQEEEEAQEPQVNESQPCEQEAREAQELPEEIVTLANAIKERGGLDNVLGLLDGLQANEDSKKAELVERLSANSACAFSKDDMAGMSLDTLTKLHKSLTPADYSGQGMELLQANEGLTEIPMPSWNSEEVQ